MPEGGKSHRKKKSGKKVQKRKTAEGKAKGAISNEQVGHATRSGSSAAALQARRCTLHPAARAPPCPQARKQNPKAFVFASRGKAKIQQARSAEKDQRRMHSAPAAAAIRGSTAHKLHTAGALHAAGRLSSGSGAAPLHPARCAGRRLPTPTPCRPFLARSAHGRANCRGATAFCRPCPRPAGGESVGGESTRCARLAHAGRPACRS